jgi:GDPmannose 4,6-dehydratase
MVERAMKKKAIVFGAAGSAGSYMVELLRDKSYDVWAMGREQCDLESVSDLVRLYLLFQEFQPDEIYNFAGKSYVPDSWKNPASYCTVNGTAVFMMLEDIRNFCPQAKFFTAGSAEVFEKGTIYQREDTNRLSSSPYGLAKMYAMDAVRLYRDHYKMFACTGIFFNMESPRRPRQYFAEKVASEAVRIKREMDTNTVSIEPIRLGRLDAYRDWGWAQEYVEVAWRMLQQEKPEDFCIGTGLTYTCEEFVVSALEAAGISDVVKDFDKYVSYDKTVAKGFGDRMCAVPLKAAELLGWSAKYKMKDVVKMLVEAEIKNEYRVGNELGSTVCGS